MSDLDDSFIEDLGSIDPMPNRDNQILVAINIDRIKYHLSKGVKLNETAGELLGMLLQSIYTILIQGILLFYRIKSRE